MRRLALPTAATIALAGALAGGVRERAAVASVPTAPVAVARPTMTITCDIDWYTPTNNALQAPPGPKACSFIADGVTQSCTIPAGQKTCDLAIPVPVRVIPVQNVTLSVPDPQTTCRQDRAWTSSGTAACIYGSSGNSCDWDQSDKGTVNYRFLCGKPPLPAPSPASNPPLSPYISVTCGDIYQDPTSGDGSLQPFPSPTCSFVAGGAVHTCVIPHGQTSCTTSVAASTLAVALAAPSLPQSQATCRLDRTDVALGGCDDPHHCTVDFARTAVVQRQFTCDSSALVSITADNQSGPVVPNHTPVTVRWTAKPAAGLCLITSTLVNSATHQRTAGQSTGTGSTGSFVTQPLQNQFGPYQYTITCQDGAGALATATATVFVQR